MPETLNVTMRWLHIASMATLVGGLLFGRLALEPASGALGPEAREALWERTAAAFRPLVYASIIGLILSGVYNMLSNPGHTPRYQAALGIKLLLAAHVFAVALLIVRPNNPRRARLATGAAISGLAILMIAAYLRRIF